MLLYIIAVYSFLLVSSIPLNGYSIVCHPLTSWWPFRLFPFSLFLAIMNKVAVNISVQVLWGCKLLFLLGTYFGMKLLTVQVIVCCWWGLTVVKEDRIGALPSWGRRESLLALPSRNSPPLTALTRDSGLALLRGSGFVFCVLLSAVGLHRCSSRGSCRLLLCVREWSEPAAWIPCLAHRSSCFPLAGPDFQGGLCQGIHHAPIFVMSSFAEVSGRDSGVSTNSTCVWGSQGVSPVTLPAALCAVLSCFSRVRLLATLGL